MLTVKRCAAGVCRWCLLALVGVNVQAGAPVFANYPVADDTRLKPSKLISFSQYPALKMYQGALLEGLKDGPNFALNYTVVEIGCGTTCQLIVVVDAKGEIVYHDQACVGAAYHLNSRLLLINPPAEDPAAFGCESKHWVLAN